MPARTVTVAATAVFLTLSATAQPPPPPPRARVLRAFAGSTPTIDGILSPGEWSDAFVWRGIGDFSAEFAPIAPAAPGAPVDLDATIFVKRDAAALYLAFAISDDVLYRAQTPPFLPGGNALANNLTQQGWPWFGDELEILFNGNNSWSSTSETASGVDGRNWQMVVNAEKSRLGGIGVGGLLEGEPRSSNAAWANYGNWIGSGAMRAATTSSPGGGASGGSAWVAEVAIKFNPCLELAAGVFYSPATANGSVTVGFQISIGDVDEPATSDTVFGLRHEMWLSGEKDAQTHLSNFGALVLEPDGSEPRER